MNSSAVRPALAALGFSQSNSSLTQSGKPANQPVANPGLPPADFIIDQPQPAIVVDEVGPVVLRKIPFGTETSGHP
jgi:hypothetical protein